MLWPKLHQTAIMRNCQYVVFSVAGCVLGEEMPLVAMVVIVVMATVVAVAVTGW